MALAALGAVTDVSWLLTGASMGSDSMDHGITSDRGSVSMGELGQCAYGAGKGDSVCSQGAF